MKTPLIAVLALSLAGNAVLAVYVLRDDSSAKLRRENAGQVASEKPAAPERRDNAGDHETDAIQPATWTQLKAGNDLHAMVENLRAAGFPPSVIRQIVHQMVGETLSSKNPHANLPYWKRSTPSKELMAAMQAYTNEREALVASLLGPDAKASAALDPEARQHRYGNLSDEKIDAIAQIEKDYNELRRQAMTSRVPGDFQSSMQQRELLEKEKREDLAALLTPQELEQYEMRQSQTANKVMSNLRNVDISEGEYTQLFRMQKAFDEVHSDSGIMNAEKMSARMEAQKSLNEQIRETLGEERFYQYLEGADPMYGMVKSFVSKYEAVPQGSAMQLYELQSDLQRQMFTSQRMSPEQRTQMFQEMNQKLDSILGPELAAEYRKQGAGRMFGASSGRLEAIRLGGN